MIEQPDKRRVLVIHTDAVLVQALRQELEALHCVVQSVTTTREAEELLLGAAPGPFGLVIMGTHLPDRNAHEFLARLEQVMPAGRPPILLAMGFGWDPQCLRPKWQQLLGERDAILYLPFRRDLLTQAVTRAWA